MASKIQVPKFSVHDFIVDRWNMEEDDVAGQLEDDSFKKRVEVLEQLIITVKRNGGRLPYADGESIFRSLGLALSDSNWEIRLKCIQLLQEIIPNLGDETDSYMSLVLNRLLANIGDSKVTVRGKVVQALHSYMKHTRNLSNVFEALVVTGLDNENPAVRREMINSLPLLLTQEFITQDLSKIINSLAKKLLETSTEDNLRDSSLSTLKKIENSIGEKSFSGYLSKLSMPLQKYYLQLSGKHDDTYYSEVDDFHQRGNNMYSGALSNRNDSRKGYTEDTLEYGFVPSHILSRINDQKDFRTRAQAVEELKTVITSSTNEISNNLLPHMVPFINFLSNLLDDSNFKIINVTLEIILSLVEKLDKNTKLFLKPLTATLLKRMGDNKVVVRQLVMSIVIKLMRTTSPQSVIDVLEDNLRHRNSRVRQETINFIIAALLTFPSYEFDLAAICQAVGPTLTDVKRAVRQAALECFATLAQGMGQGQLQPLVLAVDQVELSTDGEGLMAAVQARLARKQLPKITSDGLVEYATQTPTSATVRSSSAQQSADTEWIMAVSSTARSARSDSVDLESVNVSARSTPVVTEVSSPTSAPRRFLSAGRGRNKLPWEEDRDERTGSGNNFTSTTTNQSFSVDDTPPQPREMWVGERESQQRPDRAAVAVSERAAPKRRSTVMVLAAPEDPDTSSSYTQLYQQKLRRQQVGGGTAVRRVDEIKENGFNRQDQKTPRSFLDPITVDGDESDFVSNSSSYKAVEDESPVPRKATIARGSATRRKVPPISTSSEFEDSDSAYAASDESRSGINGSLKTIRNSATKKRADKLFEKLEKQNVLKNQGSVPVIGNHQSEDSTSPQSDLKKSIKKAEPKPNHLNNGIRGKRANDNTDADEIPGKGVVNHIEYNPISGVTFRENKQSDVQIVGRGYGDDSSAVDSKTSPSVATAKLKEKRRLNNRGLLSSYSSGGQPSMHLPGSVVQDMDDHSFPGDKGISLVGKGMFDTSNNLDHTPAVVAQSYDGRLERRKIDMKTVPAGVVGVAMRSTADLSSYSSETSGVDEDWDDENNLSLTQSLKEKVALKQQQRLEEDERRRAERERKEREKEERKESEKEEKLRRERERQQEKLKRLSSAESIHSLIESLSVSGSASGSGTSLNRPTSPTNVTLNNSPVTSAKPTVISPPKPQAPAVTTRKTLKTSNEPVSTYPMPVVSSAPAPLDSENPEDWKPFKDSDSALRDLLKKLEQEEWDKKCDGVNMLRRLCVHHPDTVLASLHSIVLAICNEVKNLRSQVSRMAIVAVGDLFQTLKRNMDSEAEITAKILLAKSGESNQFIRDDVDRALCCLVDNLTPQRALLALILGGATHKNVQIRKTSAQFIVELVEKMGSGKILSGVKDITDRILPTVANFAMDGSPETRYYGRKILHMLMTHQDFDKMLSKHLPANTLRNVQDIVDNLKQRGLGERPSELSSARSRKSGHGSRSNSSVRGGSAGNSADGGVPIIQTQRRPLVRTDEARMEEVKNMIGLMAANNWQQRYEGISNFQSMCENYPQVVASQIIKIFDKFLPRLTDSNSKVNLHALRVMLNVIPLIKDSMGSVISMTVSSVAPNLSSKNKEIYSTAAEIMNALIEHLDLALLVQPFANQAINATAKSKADMVDKVSYLVEKVYPRKQQPVVLHVLPLVWHLLGSMNSSGAAVHGGNVELRHATVTLVNKLYECMGQALLDRASAEPSNTQRQIQMLQSLLDSSS